MVKTRSQVLHPTVKKEEENEDKTKLEKLLHGTTRMTKNETKITKYKKTKTWVVISPRFAKVKTETSPSKDLDSTSKVRFSKKRPKLTKEKIENLIGYIVNDKMCIRAASRKAGMSSRTGSQYYRQYKNDQEHKIPLPREDSISQTQRSAINQKKINDLIHYIVDEKMNITQAAKKARIGRDNAAKYYAKYLEDKDHKIPKLDIPPDYYTRRCTQEQINNLISYIVDKKMTLDAAAEKAGMAGNTAKRYYFKYLNHPNHKIPAPGKFDIGGGKSCTNEEVKTLIHCIVNEGMTLLQAAIRANMGKYSASKYYRQYMKDPNHKIPTPETDNISKKGLDKRHTPDQVKKFFTYIIIDKLNISHASRKANMSENSGSKYYKKLLEYPNSEGERAHPSYTPEKMKNLVKYVQRDKMSFSSAAEKADIAYSTAHKYYQQYINDPHHKIPAINRKRFTHTDIKRLIDYIEHDKMSVRAAANKVGMSERSAHKHYATYKNDPDHKIYVPTYMGRTKKYNCSQIIADIYKENPSIQPIHLESTFSHNNSILESLEGKND